MYAYPIMLQVVNAVTMHSKALSRATDLTELHGHLIRVLNQMHAQIVDQPRGKAATNEPEVVFLLAGYSWRLNDFRTWQFLFDKQKRQFFARRATFHHKRTKGTKYFAFVGDYVSEAVGQLYQLLHRRARLTTGGLDMEPFEVLVEFIRSGRYPSIGGPPQVVKIYRHSNFLPHSIYWPSRAQGTLSLFGRALLPYERLKYLALDPDTLEVVDPDEQRATGRSASTARRGDAAP